MQTKLVEGPYIHHCVGIHQDVVPILYEACKYIGVKPDLYEDVEQKVIDTSDWFQTARLIEKLLEDDKPACVIVGRNPVEDIYREDACPFEEDHAERYINKPSKIKVITNFVKKI